MTINTDNRLMTDTTVTKELLLCHQKYGWSLDKIKEVLIAGFKSAFLPYREKSDLLRSINAELATFSAPSNGETRAKPTDAASANCIVPEPTAEPTAEPITEITR